MDESFIRTLKARLDVLEVAFARFAAATDLDQAKALEDWFREGGEQAFSPPRSGPTPHPEASILFAEQLAVAIANREAESSPPLG